MGNKHSGFSDWIFSLKSLANQMCFDQNDSCNAKQSNNTRYVQLRKKKKDSKEKQKQDLKSRIDQSGRHYLNKTNKQKKRSTKSSRKKKILTKYMYPDTSKKTNTYT